MKDFGHRLKIEPQDGGAEAEKATHQASVSPPPAALGTLVDISYSPVASPPSPVVCRRGALFSIEANPLFPSETELGCQGLWLWLLGGVKSAAVQTKEGRRQPQQRQLAGNAALPVCLFVLIHYLYGPPLSGIKGSKETCSKDTRDVQTSEHKI